MEEVRDQEKDALCAASVNQAETLPTGWRWKDAENGTGCLMNPDNEEFFIYDAKPYGARGGILYQVRAKDNTQIHWGELQEYKEFVEETVNEILTINGEDSQQNSQPFDCQM